MTLRGHAKDALDEFVFVLRSYCNEKQEPDNLMADFGLISVFFIVVYKVFINLGKFLSFKKMQVFFDKAQKFGLLFFQ